MKYFIHLSHPGPTQGIYVISADIAKQIYIDLAKERLIQDAELMFREGKEFFVKSGESGIWGEDISEKELFAKILSGEIRKGA